MTRLTFEKHGRLLAAVGAIAVVVTAIAVSTPALAKDGPVVVVANPDLVTRRVTYADLNLASLPGEAALNRRVGNAVNSLCVEATGGEHNIYGFNVADRNCRTSAWTQARPQISRAIHRARDFAATGTSTIAAVGISLVIPQ